MVPGACRRRRREERTLAVMVTMYCRAHHDGVPLCEGCRDLFDYARGRLDRCPHWPAKPACSSCRVHCYAPDARQRIRRVMKFAGPRMVLRHPVLAVCHMMDILRSP
ncbi:MAG: nitrous oxide-stimulated promoter family protein [Chitinivibrionales bacterium]|nr:nitrous oxide-stimulated promoter family protein [Chitinivibrionales bacterium]